VLRPGQEHGRPAAGAGGRLPEVAANKIMDLCGACGPDFVGPLANALFQAPIHVGQSYGLAADCLSCAFCRLAAYYSLVKAKLPLTRAQIALASRAATGGSSGMNRLTYQIAPLPGAVDRVISTAARFLHPDTCARTQRAHSASSNWRVVSGICSGMRNHSVRVARKRKWLTDRK
jgi:hypothetical protein